MQEFTPLTFAFLFARLQESIQAITTIRLRAFSEQLAHCAKHFAQAGIYWH